MGDPDGDIDAFVDKIHDAIDEQHVGADLRVALQKFVYDRGRDSAARTATDAVTESLPTGSVRRATKNVLCLLRGGENVAAALQDTASPHQSGGCAAWCA